MSRRVRLECGTVRAARLHHRRREPLDSACAHAWEDHLATRSSDLAPCGSPAAYRRHLRRLEPIDPACLAAHRADVATYQGSPA